MATNNNNNNNTTSTNMNHNDMRYEYDNEELERLRVASPWTKDPKYFEKVAISPVAIMKMMMHCQSGVDKGIAKGGNPIEVMGMLLGRPDANSPRTLVIADAFPLPIEGFETRVIADDEDVVNHMIELGEALEITRNEKFMGWYHSHPFDVVPERSHCFLSQTDLSTELQWQRAEDPHGNPFVAIVVDPLKTKATNTPQLKAFRAYPPEYNSPIAHECPDGSIQPIEQYRLEHWGSCWNRYYELSVEYYMSSTSRMVLETLTQNYLWMRNLNQKPVDVEKKMQENTAQFVTAISSVAAAANNTAQGGSFGGGGGTSTLLTSSSGKTAVLPTTILGGSTMTTTTMTGGGGGGTSRHQYNRGVGARNTPQQQQSGQQQQQDTTRGGASNKTNHTTSTTEGGGGDQNKKVVSELTKAVQNLVALSTEQISSSALERTKEQVFQNLTS